LVVGFAPEATQSHLEKKSPMGFQIDQGKVYLGHVAGEGHKVGDTVEILGSSFEVARILPPHGTADEDIAICMHLKDAQRVLNKPGKLSEILALGCKCKTVERLEEVTAQLELVLPEAKITEMRVAAIARQDQRNLVEAHHAQLMDDYRTKQQAIIAQEKGQREQIIRQEREHRAQVIGLLSGLNMVVTPLVILACALWVGLLAWSNVRERRTEIGLLRALGKGSSGIALLFLGKAVLLGSIGGIVGCLIGFLLSRSLATSMLHVTLENFTPSLILLAVTVVGTPFVAAMASYLPTLSAVNQDPAVVLMEN
jgi:ABC-type lipoprotein release transport system permease subunit